MDLLKAHGLAEFHRNPPGFFLTAVAARLQLALGEYAVDFLNQLGYVRVTVPHLVRTAVLEGCGVNPLNAVTDRARQEDRVDMSGKIKNVANFRCLYFLLLKLIIFSSQRLKFFQQNFEYLFFYLMPR